MKRRGLWLLTMLLGGSIAYAQDPQMSLFYALPTYLNPAFAGGAHHNRAIVHYRMQWPKNDARYSTFFASYDTYFANQKLGLGAVVMSDNQGSGTIKTNDLNIVSSYEIDLSKRFALRPALSLGLANRKVDDNLTYGNQFNNAQGLVSNNTGENFDKYSVLYPDVGAGMLFYDHKFWFGVSAKHLNMPNNSFLQDSKNRLPINMNFHTGMKIRLVHKEHISYLEEERDISITPVAHYKFQGKSDQLDLGLYTIYDKLLLGAWYRGLPIIKKYSTNEPNNEGLVFMMGYNFGEVTFSYAYDATISKLVGYTNGAHEVNLTYIFQKHHKQGHKIMKRLPCPNLNHPHSQ